MEQSISKISVVVPVYNASKVLYELQKELDAVFKKLNIPYQLILVDDYSRDDSWQVIKELKNQNPDKVIAVRLARNFGQHNAIFCGLRYSTGDFVLTIDDDMQHPPSEIPLLIEKQKSENADVVYGVSKQYKKSPFRKLISWLHTSTSKLTEGLEEGSPFRLIKKSIVKKLISHNQYFVYVDDLLAWYTHNIVFVRVRHDASKVKRSRYNFISLLNIYYELALGHNGLALKTITWMGFMGALLSFLVGTYFIMRKLFFHVRLGFTGIIVSITFTAAMLLFSMGFIGEHLRRMYKILNAQPQFSVAEVLE